MKRFTWLGLFILLSLVLAACSSAAEVAIAPEFQAKATPADEPVNEGEVEPVDEGAIEPVDEGAIEPVDEGAVEPVEEKAEESEDEAEVEPVEEEAVEPEAEAEMQQVGSINEIAKEDGRFNTLASGLEAAGLAGTFAGEGEFTFFAPTDDAFATLPQGTVDSLFADPTGALKNVLQYHAVDGVVTAQEMAALTAASTLAGQDVAVSVTGNGQIILNGSVHVIIADIQASNGVIHVIDAVLIPAGRG